ncbi:MAG TPA: SH3 domain-containing protein [Kofleriaceae bacterium]|jgi:opacity protein-like surface antigen
MRRLALVVFLGIGLASGAAAAEKVKTNQPTSVFARAGEHGAVILKLEAGKTLTVLTREGRWLKVRVSGRTGYIPRSKVDLPDDDSIQRNTRRRPFVDGRGTKRGFDGESGPEDRIGADAVGEGNTDSSDEADEPKKPATKPKKPPADEEDEDSTPKPAAKPKKPKKPPSDEDENPLEGDQGDKGDKGDKGDDAPPPPSDDRPRAHVSAKTKVYEEPSKASGEAFTASKSTVLIVGEAKGKYTFVETDDGDAGYVLTSKLDVDSSSSSGPRHRMIALRARLGVTFLNQHMQTPGGTTTVPDNYSLGSSSFDLALGGQILYPYKADYLLGGEIAYNYNKAVPGISYMGETDGFALHDLDVRAMGGYDFHKQSGLVAFARLGYRYEAFRVANYADFTKNTAMLPNETIKGPTIGAALAMPRITDKIGARLSMDVLAFGSMKQTENLEDGTGPHATAFLLGLGGTYRWRPQMDIQATYDLNYESVGFDGPAPTSSMRGHMGTGQSSRSDVYHTISVGIGYAF